MKRLLSLLLSVITVVTACLFVPVGASAADTITTVDLTQTYQTMNGFGASACWWSQDVGGWENADEIMSLLYSKESGIGLNIYRYNLGAGSKGDSAIYIANRSTESFIDADGNYNWDNDANARKCLAAAENAAGDDLRVTLFCNSAPVIYTVNGKGYGSPASSEYAEYETNLSSDNYQKFADYCYNCAAHFIDSGYRVTDVSPINEPQYSWRGWYNSDGTTSASQEGCYFTNTQARDLLKVFVTKFNGSELDKKGCKVSMFESGAIEGDGTTFSSYMNTLLSDQGSSAVVNKTLRNYFDTVSVHSYWSGTDTKNAAAQLMSEKYSGYNIAATEYCQMENDGNNGVYDLVNGKMSSGLTIEYGIALANIIYDDLTILNANEWDWWTACAYGGYTDGLVYLDENTHEIQTSKRMWSLGNFSKFTDEGSVRVASSTSSDNLKSVSFSNPDGSISIVFINSGSTDIDTNINLTGYDKNVESYTAYVTDASRDLVQYQSGASLSDDIVIPAQSVATVVVKGEAPVPPVDTTEATEPTTVTTTSPAPVQSTQPAYSTASAPSQAYTNSTAQAPDVMPAQNDIQQSTAAAAAKASTTAKTVKTQKPKATSIKKLTKGKKKFKVTWKKISGVTGYQIQYATDKKFRKNKKTVTVKGSKTTSKTISKLKSKKTYYVRVRTYKTVKVNGKSTKVYSSWSKVKSVKTK